MIGKTRTKGRRSRTELMSKGCQMAMPIVVVALFLFGVGKLVAKEPDVKPNFLWLSSEDNGPHLGCYGDKYATTPNLDALAKRGTVYRFAWSNAPVCAPARTAIITGMYPTSLGAEHMRSMLPMPKGTKMFPAILREHGYYCTNHSKEDYNVEKSKDVWDVSSKKAHWRNRNKDQPFFAVFNFTISHESQIRKRPHQAVHDPAKAPVPPYHPDLPAVRKDWAQYYDKVSKMDEQAGKKLKQLATDGLVDDTIVFYFGDHGSGMPRSKRYPGNSGLHVPLIVYVPEKFKHLRSADYKAGGDSKRLVSFVDFGPTVLSLAGIEPPKWMQGQAFLGKHQAKPKQWLHGFRGRMDERYDLVRSVRDERFVYIRNFYPHRPHGQFIDYQFQTPTTRLWFEQFQAGKLNEIQAAFWKRRPVEELYDLEADPHETKNLAFSKDDEIQDRLKLMRETCLNHAIDIADVGFVPEPEMHRISKGISPRDALGKESTKLQETIRAAFRLMSGEVENDELEKDLVSENRNVRFWAYQCINARPELNLTNNELQLLAGALAEGEPTSLKVLAHSIWIRHSPEYKKSLFLISLADLETNDPYTVFLALNEIDYLDEKVLTFQELEDLKKLPRQMNQWPTNRIKNYPARLLEKIISDLELLKKN